MKILLSVAAVLCLMWSGCVPPKQAIISPTPSLFLENATTRRTTRGITAEFTFPAGEYRAKFGEDRGIFYEPIASVIRNGKPVTMRILVSKDGRHGVALDTAYMIDWLSEPLPFRAAP